jgi:hypothetical protein
MERTPRYKLYRRLGGPHSRSGRYGEKNLLPLPGIEHRLLGCPTHSVVAIRTELSRLFRIIIIIITIIAKITEFGINTTEWVDIPETLGYPEVSCDFPQYLQTNSGILCQSCKLHPSKSFAIYQSSYQYPLYGFRHWLKKGKAIPVTGRGGP